MNTVEAEILCKNYGSAKALDSFSLKLRKGEKYCLLGENGAGKTTALAILSGMIRSYTGKAYVLWMECRGIDGNARIGSYLQGSHFSGSRTVREALELTAKLKKSSNSIEILAARLMLGMKTDVKTAALSHGYSRMLGIASALLGEPEVVILDEPTSGLDPKMAAYVRKLIKSLKCTVLMSTHICRDAEECCSRVGIMSKGRIVKECSPQGVEKTYMAAARNF